VRSGSRLRQTFLNPGLGDRLDLPTGEALLPGKTTEVIIEFPEDLEDDRIDLVLRRRSIPRAASLTL